MLLEIFHLTLQMKVGALVAGDLALGLLVDTQHELHDRFRIPRASTASSSGLEEFFPELD